MAPLLTQSMLSRRNEGDGRSSVWWHNDGVISISMFVKHHIHKLCTSLSLLQGTAHYTLKVLVNFCPVLSEFVTWSFLYKKF